MEIFSSRDIDPRQWNTWAQSRPHASVLQSWQWGILQEREGRAVERWAAVENGELVAGMQVIRYDTPMGRSYGYIPRGFIGRSTENIVFALAPMLSLTDAWLAGSSAIFLRVDMSAAETESALVEAFWREAFRPAPMSALRSAVTAPTRIAVLSLVGTVEEMERRMKPKTRYNLGVARRRGVETAVLPAASAVRGTALDDFFILLRKTAQRGKFSSHHPSHYRGIIETFGENAFMVEARCHNTLCASLVVVVFGDTATFLHGGSSREHADTMASYAAHWAAMAEARRRGCLRYDFGAVARKSRRDPLEGITRFKLGWGSDVVEYGHPMDRVYAPVWYRLYTIGRILRR